MNLKIVTPTRIVVDERVVKVTVQGRDGSRTYLPRHVDFVTVVVPSVMSWRPAEGEEQFAAVDEGIVVKAGDEMLVSTVYAVHGPGLGRLRETVEGQFAERGEREKTARTALAKLEASIVRRFMELGD
ncbi:MAG: F0F1 ATP synthase subunit epsilon [Armatimonadota bacterium]